MSQTPRKRVAPERLGARVASYLVPEPLDPQIGAGLTWCSGLRAGSQNPAARRAWRALRGGQIGDKRCQLGNSASETDWRASVRDDCPTMTVNPCCAAGCCTFVVAQTGGVRGSIQRGVSDTAIHG